MINGKKSVGLMPLLILLLIISFVSSAQTIQVQENPPPEKKSFFSTYFGFLKSPLFWWIIIIIIIVIILLICFFFFVRWLVKFLKSRNDIFWKLKSERISLSRLQKSYPSSHFWKVYKNTPIRLVKKSDDGKMILTEPIGYHRGDYTSHEGNIIMNLNLKDKKKWFFFPVSDILVIPNKDKVEIKQISDKGKITTITIDNLPKAKDIIQFNPNEILIFAESLSQIGLFLTPVLKSKDNKIIDLSLPIYQTLKEVILGDYLYSQTGSFADLSKKGLEINPYIRSINKLQDSSSNVEIPSTDKK